MYYCKILLGMSIIQLIFSCLLVVPVHKRMPKLAIPWLSETTFMTAVITIYSIVLRVSGAVLVGLIMFMLSGNFPFSIVLSYINKINNNKVLSYNNVYCCCFFVCIVLSVLILWVVFSFYHEMKVLKRTEKEMIRNGTEDTTTKGPSIIYKVDRENEVAV